jgi:hypothetical protein
MIAEPVNPLASFAVMNGSDRRFYWERGTRRIIRRINAGFFLQKLLIYFPITILLVGLASLLCRQAGFSLGLGWWLLASLLLVLSAVVAYFKARRFFYNTRDGLVLLDIKLGLNNQLTAAQVQCAPWPEPRPIPSLFDWRYPRLFIPPGSALAFLIFAIWVPVGSTGSNGDFTPQEPLSWSQVEQWIHHLDEQDTLDNNTLEAWKEQIQHLREQPAEQWYSHASLEAGDDLRDRTRDAIRQLQHTLEQAMLPVAAAQQVQQHGISLTRDMEHALGEQWQQALAAMQQHALTLDPDLLQALQEIDFSDLCEMGSEQLAALESMLREAAGSCQLCLGNGEEGDDATALMLLAMNLSGTNQGEATPTPLTLSESAPPPLQPMIEGIENPDYSQAALGDKIGTAQTTPEAPDPASFGQTTGGASLHEGTGGDAVGHSRLTPQERRLLQQYFD